MRAKQVAACWTVSVLAAASLGAGSSATLVEAVKQGDRVALRALLREHADPSAPDLDGTTGLHWAVLHDDVETVDLLLAAGANAKVANRYGITPLTVACTNGNAAIIEKLLGAGADPNTASSEGETVLMTAARTGKSNAVKVLLAHGAQVIPKRGEKFLSDGLSFISEPVTGWLSRRISTSAALFPFFS